MTLSDAELAAVSNAYMVADEYARHPVRGTYCAALARLADTTGRSDLLLAAAVHHARSRDRHNGDAVALFVGLGVPADLVYQRVWD